MAIERIRTKILDASGRPFPASALRVQRAHYDAASETRMVDFSNAQDIGPNEALRTELATMRKRIRFEMRNNGVAKGIGRKYANVLVGRGPRLKVRSSDPKWNQLVEFAFARWAKSCGYKRGESLGQMTHLGVKQFFPCGEYLMVPRMDMKATTPVKLRFLMIRPDRLQSPAGIFGEGVETDRDGKPQKYWVLKDDPDNLASGYFTIQDFQEVPPELMIHVFVEEDPIQFRAEPWLATALTVFHKLRRLDEGSLTAAEIANKFAAFLKNTIPELAQEADILLPSTMDIEDGTMTTLPVGYEPVQVKPEHPNHNISEFRRDQLAAAGAGVCVPVNAVTGDSSRHNFASARFDGLMMVSDGEVVRGHIETQQLDRQALMWLSEATRVGEVPYPPSAYYFDWLWPKNEAHTNPVDSANAAKQRLANGTVTVADEVLADGRDDTDHEERLFAEVERWNKRGLRHPLQLASKGSEPAGDEPGSQPGKPAGKTPAKGGSDAS